MGGNAVINYGIKRTNDLKGIIATSPFLRLAFEPPKIKLAVGKLLQKIAPSITMGNELDANDISREKIEVEKYVNDPLVHDKISPNFSLTFIETGKWAIENAGKLETPMLLLHGTGDKIIDYKGTQEFANNSDQATLKLYDGGYHELQNDLCKEEMLGDVVSWLNSQF
jgi:acylglycerol lipase